SPNILPLSSPFFSRHQLRRCLLRRLFAVIQYVQAVRESQKFARLKQVRGVLRTARQLRLGQGEGLAEKQSARPHRLHHLRKYSPLQIEERHHHFEPCVELGLRSLEVSEIIYYKVNVGRERSGILPRLFDSGLGNVNERDFPTLFCQPDRVPSGSSRKVESPSSLRKERKNIFRKRAHQEWIGGHRCPGAGRFPIFLVPALALVIRNRKRHAH